METFVRRFIRSSVLWLGVGVLLGLAMALWPYRALVLRPAHMHANLLGFVSMMIFGVAYHVLPRFTGRPLHDRRLAGGHLWLANLGLAGLVSGWIARTVPVLAGFSASMIGVGAALSALGAFAFIYNIWRTLDAAMVPPVAIRASARAAPAAAGERQTTTRTNGGGT